MLVASEEDLVMREEIFEADVSGEGVLIDSFSFKIAS